MNLIRLTLFVLLFFSSSASFSQDVDSSSQAALQLPKNYYAKVDKKISSVNEQLTKKSVKYLARFQKQEAKVQKRLQKLNPEIAIDSATIKYKELSQKNKK